MDTTTSLTTIVAVVCIKLFGIAVVAGALYGVLVWYPAQRKKKVDELKASGRQGEATIIRLPKHKPGPGSGRGSVFTMVPIGLEIRVVGIEPYEVDKDFTFPTHARDKLEVGTTVAVWVDPDQPRNLHKIVIDVE